MKLGKRYSKFTMHFNANWLKMKSIITPSRSFKKLKWYNWLGFYWFHTLLIESGPEAVADGFTYEVKHHRSILYFQYGCIGLIKIYSTSKIIGLKK